MQWTILNSDTVDHHHRGSVCDKISIGCSLFKTRVIIHSLTTGKFESSWPNQFGKSI